MTLDPAVSQLAWYTTYTGYRSPMTSTVYARRVGPDEWVMSPRNDFHHQHFNRRGKITRPHYSQRARFTTTEVMTFGPRWVEADARAALDAYGAPEGELTVHPGFIPKEILETLR